MEHNGAQWVQLGVFELATGTGAVVELGNDANEYVVADALMLTHEPHGVAADEVVIDNTSAGTSWSGMSLDTWYSHWGANYRYTLSAGASKWFRWPATYVPSAGRYHVYARWTTYASATNAPYTVYHDGGSTTARVNQRANTYAWVRLGSFDLTPGSGPLVQLTQDANGTVVADAIRLVRARDIEAGPWTFVDNTAATTTGTWTASTSTTGGWFYSSNWVYAASGAGGSSIEWPMAVPTAGRYNILAHCPQAAGNTTAARYVVHHDGGTTDVTVNQTVNGSEWVPIGTYNLTPASNSKVHLDNNQAGTVCADAIAFGRDLNDRRVVADAVKFVPNTAEAALTVHADHLGSPQKMTGPAGAVVWDASYKPFGEEAAISGASTNNQRFPGQYFDAETGLHYNWMRDYDASLGRYVQSDPIGLAGGGNTYAYVAGNPLVYSDPTGEFLAPVVPVVVVVGIAIVHAVTVGIGVVILSDDSDGSRGKSDTPQNSKSQCEDDDDNDDCKDRISDWRLKLEGIDAHELKREYLGNRAKISRYELCKCKDGTVAIRFKGCIGPIMRTSVVI